MQKRIFIINGEPHSGKDMFVSCFKCITHEPTIQVSMIDKIKQVAKTLGWNEIKDLKSRKFLSDLKDITDEYNNYSMNYIEEKIVKFLNQKNPNKYMFIHARSPYDIEYLKNKYNNIQSILIVRDKDTVDEVIYDNHADKDIYDYTYDYELINPGDSIKKYNEIIMNFYESIKEDEKEDK